MSGSKAHLLLLWVCAPAWGATVEYAQFPFSLSAETEQLIVADSNGDGLNDLIAAGGRSLFIYFQDQQGFDFQQEPARIQFDGKAVGWDLSYGYGNPASASVIALIDGTRAQVWPVEGQTVQPPELIRDGLPGFLNNGVTRLHFSRDINNDGLEDLVVPGAGIINLFVNRGDGSYQPPLGIASAIRLRTELGTNRLNQSIGQAVRIPRLELRDVNGDGADDLVSRTPERLDVFIAQPAGNPYLPRQASWSLDIAAMEEQLGEFDIDNLDFSNLTGVLALTHEEILDDVNGDGIDDLLLREGGKVSLFRGDGRGMDLTAPQQVLRSAGNVLSTFLHDENGDGLKDLWLWRVEAISVGDIFVWMALSGSIAIEAFVYPNEGERFARRPTRKITVDLQFPSVMGLAGAYEDLSAQLDELENTAATPTATAHLNDNLARAELLALMDNQVQIFFDAMASATDDSEFLGGLGYSRQQDRYRIDIGEIIDNAMVGNARALQQVQDRPPDMTVPLDVTAGAPTPASELFTARINGDAVDDAFVFTHHDAGEIRGILLLSH